MEDKQILDLPRERETYIVQASMGMRFGNYIVDLILAYGCSLLTALIIGYFLFRNADQLDDETLESRLALVDNRVFGIGLNFTVIALYYFLQEHFLKGKTIGKFITRTRAVREDGSRISAGGVIGRSLSRLIPFEPFSFLGDRGWHDSISGTIVVDERETVLPSEF